MLQIVTPGDNIIEGEAIIKMARERLLDKKGEQVQILDVRGLSTITDFFVIASGTSLPHLKALAQDLEVELKHRGAACYRKSGSPESGWMILDYVDVVIHLMSSEARNYYGLEALWGDAPVVEPAA